MKDSSDMTLDMSGAGYLNCTNMTSDSVREGKIKDYWDNSDILFVECDLLSKVKHKIRKKLDKVCGAKHFFKSFAFTFQNNKTEVIVYTHLENRKKVDAIIQKFVKSYV